VGRVGCFFNGCCYGRQVQAFGVVFPGDAVERAPVQVYEALGLILLAIGLEIASRRRRPAGRILSAYLAAYGALRFVLEAWRADQPTVGFLTPPQWTSVALVLAAFALGLRREGSGVRGKA
jgi:phosphatidylglycerol---prolipoprotein diacylglyceryl transferase